MELGGAARATLPRDIEQEVAVRGLTALIAVLREDGDQAMSKQDMEIFFSSGAADVEFVAEFGDADKAHARVAIGVPCQHIVDGNAHRANEVGIVINDNIIQAVGVGTWAVAVGLRHEKILSTQGHSVFGIGVARQAKKS
jgi:hypothetical protein